MLHMLNVKNLGLVASHRVSMSSFYHFKTPLNTMRRGEVHNTKQCCECFGKNLKLLSPLLVC